MLLLTAAIWGSAFVAQIVGMEHIGPFTFNAVRNIIGGLTLLITIQLLNKNKVKPSQEEKRTLIQGGLACGVVLFIASSLQQIGIQYTTAGKAGFITTLYIVIVPILGIFLGKKVSKKIWVCVLIAATGLYLLSIKSDFSIGKGDTLIFLCAIFFSIHILVIDHFSPKVDGVVMSCIQFFVCGTINIFAMLLFESPTVREILLSWAPILYAGVLSSGVGYTLQIVAQKDTDPTITSLILSLESVFAVLAGVLILGETLTTRETFGCVMIFIAIIAAQIPSRAQWKKLRTGAL